VNKTDTAHTAPNDTLSDPVLELPTGNSEEDLHNERDREP